MLGVLHRVPLEVGVGDPLGRDLGRASAHGAAAAGAAYLPRRVRALSHPIGGERGQRHRWC